jgi:hypothetical protein
MASCAQPAKPAVTNSLAPRLSLRCPAPPPGELASTDDPPWERDPLGLLPTCIETEDGARVTLTKDPSDPDGWREWLTVADGAHTRYRREVRAVTAMALAPDGGVVLAHTEDAVSRYSPTGTLQWKTPHPRCGAPVVSVAYDGRVVLGCGYSILAFSPEGQFLWQKWPLGNLSVGRPLLGNDRSIIVRAGAIVAKLDSRGEVRWRVDAGFNRYVFPLGVRADGTLVFRTGMDELHTPGDVHIYYPSEPQELFAITRDGRLLARRSLDQRPLWPTTLAWTPALRSGRLP